ncbi:hypothetical protein QBC46DRAFT_388643 [Diplogelasinospora grovesii]|uniref:Uncharacterized protein n=1 Tax=Diplogelasinospora grovesii TaxID=303347 RepID=A0AAN6N4X4_9PEZI|nr:hypothetical protein QBC46DRAFT_388643 [Diplogelasinospora grovesii]
MSNFGPYDDTLNNRSLRKRRAESAAPEGQQPRDDGSIPLRPPNALAPPRRQDAILPPTPAGTRGSTMPSVVPPFDFQAYLLCTITPYPESASPPTKKPKVAPTHPIVPASQTRYKQVVPASQTRYKQVVPASQTCYRQFFAPFKKIELRVRNETMAYPDFDITVAEVAKISSDFWRALRIRHKFKEAAYARSGKRWVLDEYEFRALLVDTLEEVFGVIALDYTVAIYVHPDRRGSSAAVAKWAKDPREGLTRRSGAQQQKRIKRGLTAYKGKSP